MIKVGSIEIKRFYEYHGFSKMVDVLNVLESLGVLKGYHVKRTIEHGWVTKYEIYKRE